MLSKLKLDRMHTDAYARYQIGGDANFDEMTEKERRKVFKKLGIKGKTKGKIKGNYKGKKY
jgi:hypothetical protein